MVPQPPDSGRHLLPNQHSAGYLSQSAACGKCSCGRLFGLPHA